MINEWGTVIGLAGTETIIPMNDLVNWLGCKVNWTDNGLSINHPVLGTTEVEI